MEEIIASVTGTGIVTHPFATSSNVFDHHSSAAGCHTESRTRLVTIRLLSGRAACRCCTDYTAGRIRGRIAPAA